MLVIGSGPIVIGQAAEFDYAGAQACRVLQEAGVNVVLVNSNPATIMTDSALADEIYLEPLNAEHASRASLKRRSRTACWPGWAGQTGLTIAMQLSKEGFLEQLRRASCSALRRARPSTRRRTASCSRTPWSASASPCIPSDIAERCGQPRWQSPKRSAIPSSCARPSPWAARAAALRTDADELREIAAQRAGAVPHHPGAGGTMHRRLEGNRI